MGAFHVGLLGFDGRTRGTYVYMLMFSDRDAIRIKVGMARDPIQRCKELLVGCPFEPEILAVVGLPTKEDARVLERELHSAFKPWHTRGEWFDLRLSDKSNFNTAWKRSFAALTRPSWPLKWTKIPVAPLLADGRRRAGLVRAIAGRCGIAQPS